MVEMQHFVHFVAVAEELHFGRAAARIGIAQPALSQSIARLEQRLGVNLLDRSGRRATLTPAGRVFLDEARKTVAQAQLSIGLARRAASGDAGHLRISFVASAQFWLVPPVVRHFLALHPQVMLTFEELPSAAQLAGLHAGTIDVGILFARPDDLGGLDSHEVRQSRLMAVLPAHHALARRKRLKLSDLAPCPFVLATPGSNPASETALLAACRQAGFAPRVVQYAPLMHTQLCLVAGGLGVSVMPDVARFIPIPGLAFVPLAAAAPEPESLRVAWLPKGQSAALLRFVERVTELAHAID